MTSLLKLIGRFFLAPQAIAALIVAAGTICLVVAAAPWGPGEIVQWWRPILHEIGVVVLSAGVFTAITKTFVFAGIFDDTVKKFFASPVFEEQLLKTLDRHEEGYLEPAWKRRTQGVFGARIPHPKHITAVIHRLSERLGVPLTGTTRGYCSSVSADYTISWFDRPRGILKVEERQNMHIATAAATDELDYHVTWSGDPTATKSVVNVCRVDGKQLTSTQRIVEGRLLEEFRERLSGSVQYHVFRESTRHECIFVEPFVHRGFTRHVVTLNVTVDDKADGIHSMVVPIGEHAFKNQLQTAGHKQFFTAEHLLPGEGFVLLFVTDGSANSGPFTVDPQSASSSLVGSNT